MTTQNEEGEGILVAVDPAPEVGELAAALAKAQLAFRAIVKDKVARIQMKESKGGGTYTYRYADLASILEVVRKPLADNGLAFTQPIQWRDGGLWLDTILMHTSGQTIRSEYPLPQPGGSPQAMGSAITYARRYCLGAALGIATEEDDDAAKAKATPDPKKRITKKQYESLTQAAKVKGYDKDAFIGLIEKVCDHQNPTRLTIEQYEKALAILKLEEVADKVQEEAAEAKAEEKKPEKK